MTFALSIDLAQLARQARIPADEPGVATFAKLIADHCAGLCETARPEGDADHVSASHAHAVGRELAAMIRAQFQVY